MIRGTSHDQDARFKDKAQKMLLQSKWPDKYDIKIDLTKVAYIQRKVDLQIMKMWIQKRTTELLGQQDDVVSGTVFSLLEQALSKQQKPNAKKMHIGLSGFLTNNTLTFMSELWDLLDQAQKSKSGIPKQLLDSKKAQQLEKKQRLKDLSHKKQKIKNYKFNIIQRHVGRQKQPSVQVKRKQRENQRDYSHERKSKKNKKYKQRSYSRDKKKKRRRSQQQSQQKQFQNQNRREKKDQDKKRKKHKRNYSSSRSRSRQKQKKVISNLSHKRDSASAQKKRQKKQKQKKYRKKSSSSQEQKEKKKVGNESPSKSQSSQVVSSSNSES